MASDGLILQALTDKARYRALRDAVPVSMLSPESQTVLAWYPLYFQAYPEHERIDWAAMDALVKLRSGYNAEQMAIMRHALAQAAAPVDEVAVKGVVNSLYERDFSGRAAALIARY